jgi:hopanoid-associated phosphorylase
MTAEAAPILAVTGLAREARIAAGPGIATIGAGGSPARLRAVLRDDAPPCRGVVSFGIAAGLDPALRPGTIVVATGIVAADGRRPADPDIARFWASRLRQKGETVVAAEIAGVDIPLLGAEAKHAVRAATQAAAADMESHVAAEFAAERGVPFGAIRVVCDPAERELPPLVAEALNPAGAIDVAAILRSLARQPAQIAALPRLTRDAALAFASLSRVGAALGPGFGLGGLRLGEPLGDVL